MTSGKVDELTCNDGPDDCCGFVRLLFITEYLMPLSSKDVHKSALTDSGKDSLTGGVDIKISFSSFCRRVYGFITCLNMAFRSLVYGEMTVHIDKETLKDIIKNS